MVVAEPLSNIDRVYQAFAQDERVRSMARTKTEPLGDASIFAMQGRSDNRAENARLTCKYCKKTCHDDTTCFKIHGVPAW